MTTASQPITHVHNYQVDNLNKGTCKCGRIVKFHNEDPNTKNWWTELLAKGDLDYKGSEQPVLKPAENLTVTLTGLADPPAAEQAVKAVKISADYATYYAQLKRNRNEILADLETLGRERAAKKWGISRRSIGQLILARERANKKAGIKSGKEAEKPAAPNMPENIPVLGQPEPQKDAYETANLNKNQIADISLRLHRSHDLPPFPVWSNDWETEVQMEWLSAYRELRLAK